MRGIGRTISRLSTARAVLAGAALLAGAAMRPAHGETGGGKASQPDETAMAVPRIAPPAGASGLGLPQPLAPSEAARLRRIFALQRRGDIPAAMSETGRLSDDTLLGHVLADRYLSPHTRAAAPELSGWLGRYADLPDACAIYSLLLKRLPPGAPRPAPPSSASLANAGDDASSPNAGGAARDAFRRGLAAWRHGNAAAASWFGAASVAPSADPDLRAAAAYWAARTHKRQGDEAAWHAWMVRAAAEPQTLHGMLARHVLGLRPPAPPPTPTLGQADLDAVAATPQGRRAFALLQIGEPDRAEAELRHLWPLAENAPSLSRAVFLVASAAGLPDLVADLSGLASAGTDALPVPVLRPRGGFRLDRALVYAVAKVESNFASTAVSGAGAHGLMQLLPVAAGAVMKTPLSARSLREPGMNLKVGQDYLAYLSGANLAGDDLLRVLASYNAGPGAVQSWARAADGDPLMFLETIPADETRQFVRRALVGMWGYAARFGTKAPSLDALAAGAWPRFSPEFAKPSRISLALH